MNVYEEYQKKLTTPQQAVQCIQSGDWVDYGVCAGHPVALDRALAQRGAELHDVKIRGMNALWLPEIAKIPDAAQHFCWNSWAMMGDERKMQKLGMCYYAPLRYSELPRFYRENLEPNAVAMFRVTPMDEHGNFNFGPSCSHMAAAASSSRSTRTSRAVWADTRSASTSATWTSSWRMTPPWSSFWPSPPPRSMKPWPLMWSRTCAAASVCSSASALCPMPSARSSPKATSRTSA